MVCLVWGQSKLDLLLCRIQLFLSGQTPLHVTDCNVLWLSCTTTIVTFHNPQTNLSLYFVFLVGRHPLALFLWRQFKSTFQIWIDGKKAACWHENLQNLLGRTILYFVLDSTLNKPALHVNLSKMAELVLSLLWADSIYYQYRISILMLT